MDFNVKKLASDAGVFFTRAVQVRRLAWLPAWLPPWGLMGRCCIRRWQQLWASLLSASRKVQRCFSASEREISDPHPGTSGDRSRRRPLEAINGL